MIRYRLSEDGVIRYGFLKRPNNRAPSLAMNHQGGVYDDPRQPGRDLGSMLEFAEIPERGNHRILYSVFSVFLIL